MSENMGRFVPNNGTTGGDGYLLTAALLSCAAQSRRKGGGKQGASARATVDPEIAHPRPAWPSSSWRKA